MNFRMIFYVLGRLFRVEAALLAISLLVSLMYGENLILAFAVPIVLLLVVSIFTSRLKKPQNARFFSKDGFIVVAVAWFLLSFFGCLPFWISREVPSLVDCFFETVSGFTTTGSSVIDNIEDLSHGLLFWRSFTNWIGGMGILVFVLAFFPEKSTQSFHIMKAESPGPQVGKIVSKLKLTARILYGIYIAMTLLEIFLLMGGGMPLFDSIVNSFSTAGTGGFSIKSESIGAYNSAYFEYVIAIFMILFGINFNVFYLLLIKRFSAAYKSEELRIYLGIIFVSVAVITLNILQMYSTFEGAFRDAFFQVSSIMTTTGFVTADFDTWPTLSKSILVLLMVLGGCAGSTSGGMKISRVVLLLKSAFAELKRCVSPNTVTSIKLEGKNIDKEAVQSANGYLVMYVAFLAVSTVLVSIDGMDFESTFTIVVSCLNNIGPGFSGTGPTETLSSLSIFSKLVLAFNMVVGRLEIFPVLVLMSPKTYRK